MSRTRSACRRRSQIIIEACETRRMFNDTPHVLADGPLEQDWSNSTLIQFNNDWNSVPSIRGFGGNGIVGAPATPPGGEASLAVNYAGQFAGEIPLVYANLTDPEDENNPFGIAEFELEDNVVALRPDVTHDAPFLMFNLNTLNVANIPMSFRLRELQETSNTVKWAVQYWNGEITAWNNPFSNVAEGVFNPDANGDEVITIDPALLANVANQELTHIRIIVTDAVGDDVWVGVDDIQIGESIAVPWFKFAPLEDNQILEGDTGVSNILEITVLREGNVNVAATVEVAIAGGTATNGNDYGVGIGIVNFEIGETFKKFEVFTSGDEMVENTEYFILNLVNAQPDGQVRPPSQQTVWIIDDDSEQSEAVLNEVLVDPGQTLTDDGFEYFEVRGESGQKLYNTYFVSLIGDGGFGNARGVVEYVFPLGDYVLGANGLLMVKSAVGGHLAQNPTTTVVLDPNLNANSLDADGAFGNGARSFMLVYSRTPIAAGQDLDANNNGTLDNENQSIVDGIGWDSGAIGDVVYGENLFASQIPSGATRFVLNTDPLSRSAWYWGDLQTDRGAADLDYDMATVNQDAPPQQSFLTPGRSNFPSSSLDFRGVASFAVSGLTVNEDAGTVSITVLRSSGSNGTITVDYMTADDSALAGSDYLAAFGTLTFLDGETSKTFDLTIIDDTDSEFAQSFTVSLGDPMNGVVLDPPSTFRVTIDPSDVVPPTGIVLNEIEVNPPGSFDNGWEYIELRGGAGQSLDGIYVVALDGDAGFAGVVKQSYAVPVGQVLGSNGLALFKSVIGGHAAQNAATTVIPYSGLNIQSLEDDSASFLLIFSVVPLNVGSDLDTNNDGTLDLPSGAFLLDGIGWTDGEAGNLVYGAALSNSAFQGIPQAATRLIGDVTPLNASSWFNGNLAGTVSSGLVYVNGSGPTLPTNALLTPGASNFDPSVDPLTVTSKQFSIDVSGTPMSIKVQFSGNVLSSIVISDDSTASLRLKNLTTDTFVPAADIQMSYTPGTNLMTLTFPNYPYGALPDGDYQLTLVGANISDGLNVLGPNETLEFRFVNGDLNHDGDVDSIDFSVLASHYGLTGARWFEGDLTFDGKVNTMDFNIFAGHFGVDLSAPAQPLNAPAPVSAGSALFASNLISDDEQNSLI